MIVMEGSHRLNVEQMSGFLAASGELEIEVSDAKEARKIVAEVLAAQRYGRLPKAAKGIVRRYLMRVTGYGRAQVTRLIGEYRSKGELRPKASRRSFPTRYTRSDIELLAEVDTAHQGLSGAAVRRLLKRGFEVFGDVRYQRLANISVSHIYNLRHTEAYRRRRTVYRATQSTTVSIAERRCPAPEAGAGLAARGYGTSGGSSRRQGWAVPHQCRRHRHAMAGGGLR